MAKYSTNQLAYIADQQRTITSIMKVTKEWLPVWVYALISIPLGIEYWLLELRWKRIATKGRAATK